MYFRVLLLICWISIAFCKPYLNDYPAKLTVTEENQNELGLPIGTVLKRDKRTGLYIPPRITDNFTPESRLMLQFGNKTTARNFCKVGPGVDGARIMRGFAWKEEWCRSNDGEDECCTHTVCSCNLVHRNCACLSPEAAEYYKNKVDTDFDRTMTGIKVTGDLIGNAAKVAAAVGT